MALADHVHIARRYQRAIRIDMDLADPSALEGFICPQSSAQVLRTMAQLIAGSGHGAFTWTGPYGSGKSSLAVALCGLLADDKALPINASSVLDEEAVTAVREALPGGANGWRILPIVGRRDHAVQVVGEAIAAADWWTGESVEIWSEKRVLESLLQAAGQNPQTTGGLLVFIDEMGKLLEAAAYDGSDIYFLQQLAEMASRSDKRLIVIGVLHQAFDEYAYRLSREAREEWAKIQGRFVDLAINVSSDEQIDLLGRAIDSDHPIRKPGALAQHVASLARKPKAPQLAQMLEDCWPLHPVVPCLLGPMSRRRFGQNQRSIFGFLTSSEPGGFQDFLRHADNSELYTPDLLWDYLRFNLEPSIMASPDGHRWALTVDALERCEAAGGSVLQLRLLKTIGLMDLLKGRSGLAASPGLLEGALACHGPEELETALDALQQQSLIIFRKFSDSYSVFEGSDFDINDAVQRAAVDIDDADFAVLNELASLQPIVAKRHYHQTGTLRWFDVSVVPLMDLEGIASDYTPAKGAVGVFFLAIPARGEKESAARETCRRVADMVRNCDIVIGLPQEAWDVTGLVKELLALGKVREETPDLKRDPIANKEVESRIAVVQGNVESRLNQAFDSAVWYQEGRTKKLARAQLNGLASDLVDSRFYRAPRLQNELLNRSKPSGSAVAARNMLLRSMVLDEGKARLGIKGFPSEGGLLVSLLEATALYRKTELGWTFLKPGSNDIDPCNLQPAWQAAAMYLRAHADRTVPVSELYDVWRQAPLGIKDGLLPVLAVAFVLSMRQDLAFYRQGIFQPRLSDLDVEHLSMDADAIQLRWMNLSDVSRRLLSDMAHIVRELDEENTLTDLEPIDVARGLVAIYDRLPPWVARTQRLSANAKRVRQLFKQANDPNKLIFDDIPHVLGNGAENGESDALLQITERMREGLTELRQAYPTMLRRLRETLLAELQVANASQSMLAELRARAENIRQLAGDHRLEAFIVRLAQFHDSDADMESLASMATNKPARNWVDSDIDRATIELAGMAQQFIRAEVFAHVKGRPDKRHAMAVVVGMGGRPAPVHDEFDITDPEREEVDALIDRIDAALKRSGEKRRNVILAALAELSARHLRNVDASGSTKRDGKKRNAS